MNSTRTWALGTALVGLMLCALAWFFLLSPRAETIAETREQIEQAEERNDALRTTVAARAADYERIDEFRARLNALRQQFPTTVQLPEFTRHLAGLVDQSGAIVRSVTIGSSQQVTASPDMPDSPDGAAAPVLPPAPEGMYAVPITLTVEGSFEQAKLYTRALQGQHQRLFLLTRLSWSAADESGIATFSINGYTYVLLSAEDLAATRADSDLEVGADGTDDTADEDE